MIKFEKIHLPINENGKKQSFITTYRPEETMSKKTISLAAIIIGLIVTLISLMADLVGIGSYPGINYAQLGGAAIGLIIVLIGLLLQRKKGEKQS